MVVSDEEEGPAGQGIVLSRRRLLYLSAVALAGGASVALLPRGPEPSPRWEAAPCQRHPSIDPWRQLNSDPFSLLIFG
jgi:hypothetical protein